MPEAAHLRRLQEQLRGAIAGAGPRALDPDGVLRSTAKLSAAERLDLYRRSHRLRLLEAMRASYPALSHMLGRELFDDLAWEYLQERPSRSYTLQRLGEAFPDYLEANRPDADGPRETWPDLMIDLARLERTFAEVYDAAGLEGEAAPTAADLPPAPDAGWLAATVEPAPCLRLVRSSFAAGPYLAAVRRGEEPALPVPAERFLALSRRDYAVRLTPLDTARYRLLGSLCRGATVEQAAAVADLAPLAAWQEVRRWSEEACFRSLRRGNPAARSSSDPKTPEKEYA